MPENTGSKSNLAELISMVKIFLDLIELTYG
jgi:hypothetical protein